MQYVLDYEAIVTEAPEEYDNFGAFTLFQYEKERLVIVSPENVEYHLGRYSSGLYATCLLKDHNWFSHMSYVVINKNLSRKLTGLPWEW